MRFAAQNKAGDTASGVAPDGPSVAAAVGVGGPVGEGAWVAQGLLNLEEDCLVAGVAGCVVHGGGGVGTDQE